MAVQQNDARSDDRWVLIESGSNQYFIFRSPKRRYNVGASALLIEVGKWVEAAATAVGDVEVVVKASSKAMLKVSSPEVGRAVISKVTESALTRAPGLDVWGVVEQPDSTEKPLGDRIKQLHDDHRDARYQRPTPHRRSLMLPFSQACALTGLAASVIDRTGDAIETPPVSDQAKAIMGIADPRHKELLGAWPGHTPQNLEDELSQDGWVAIVHADGNRVGNLMTAITNEETLRAVSTALMVATQRALDAAIREVGGDEPEGPWIIPLIVGGDDVTAIVHGRCALTFADSYLRHFEQATADEPALADLAQQVTGHPWVTASAGVLACHSKTPFSLAYHLVEAVIAEAKGVRDAAPGRSAFSFYCAGDSIPATLDAGDPVHIGLSKQDIDRRGQLYVVAGQLNAAIASGDLPKDDAWTWAQAHAASHLLKAVETLLSDEPPVSGSRVSEIRMQLGGGHLRQATIDRAKAASSASERFLNQHLQVSDGASSFTRWLDINDALSLARGKVEAEGELS